jgi:hypothetical protein
MRASLLLAVTSLTFCVAVAVNVTWVETALFPSVIVNFPNSGPKPWIGSHSCMRFADDGNHCRSANLLSTDLSDTLIATEWSWHTGEGSGTEITANSSAHVADVAVLLKRHWKEVVFTFSTLPLLDASLFLGMRVNTSTMPLVVATLLTNVLGPEVWPYDTLRPWVPFTLSAVPSYAVLHNSTLSLVNQVAGVNSALTNYYYYDAARINVTLTQSVELVSIRQNLNNFTLEGTGFITRSSNAVPHTTVRFTYMSSTSCNPLPVGTSFFTTGVAINATHAHCVQPSDLNAALLAYSSTLDRPQCVWSGSFAVAVRFLTPSPVVLQSPWVSAATGASLISIQKTFESTELQPLQIEACAPSVVQLTTTPTTFTLTWNMTSVSDITSTTVNITIGDNDDVLGTSYRCTVLIANTSHIVFRNTVAFKERGYVKIEAQFKGQSAIYQLYVAPGCLQEGQWYNGDSVCHACPQGAFCPGGDRIWPMYGFWSPHERLLPQQCAHSNACPGAIGQRSTYPVQIKSNGEHDTRRCASGEGYRGPLCTRCVTNFYRVGERCLRCDGNAKVAFTVLIIVTGLVFLGLALCVIFFPDRILDALLALIMAIQQSLAITQKLVEETGSTQLVKLLNIASIVSFRVEFVRPDCLFSGGFGFVEVFSGTFAVILVAIVVFALAALAHSGCVGCTQAVRRRLPLSFHHLAMYVYLRVSTLSVESLYCVPYNSLPSRTTQLQAAASVTDVDDLSTQALQHGYRLVVQPGLQCFTGKHAIILPSVAVTILAFVVGYPLYIQLSVWRFRRKAKQCVLQQTMSLERDKSVISHLLRNLKPHGQWLHILPLLITLTIAITNVLVRDTLLRLALQASIYIVHFAYISELMPFVSWKLNVIALIVDSSILIWLCALIHVFTKRTWPIILIAGCWLLCGLCALLAIKVSRFRKQRQTRRVGSIELFLTSADESEWGDAIAAVESIQPDYDFFSGEIENGVTRGKTKAASKATYTNLTNYKLPNGYGSPRVSSVRVRR